MKTQKKQKQESETKPLSLKRAVELHNLLRDIQEALTDTIEPVEFGINKEAITSIICEVGSFANPYFELAGFFMQLARFLYEENPGMTKETAKSFWLEVKCNKANRLKVVGEAKGGFRR